MNRYAKYFGITGTTHSFVEAAQDIVPNNPDLIVRQYQDIKARTLIVWGENDQALPADQAYKLANIISNSELKIIDECGHIPHEEKPAETAFAINDFLKRVQEEHR